MKREQIFEWVAVVCLIMFLAILISVFLTSCATYDTTERLQQEAEFHARVIRVMDGIGGHNEN